MSVCVYVCMSVCVCACVRACVRACVCVRVRGTFQRRLSYSVRTATVCMKSHASTSVRMLKIPKTGSHSIVWTDENTADTGRNGNGAALKMEDRKT